MKRLLVASVLLLTLGAAAFAQQTPYSDTEGVMQRGMMQGGMMQGDRDEWERGRGYMEHGHGRGPCMGCMVACASMVMPHLVATTDGGVVVAVGGRLVKYDANLRRVAETPIIIDWTEVQRRVEQIVQNCPMNRRMMMQQRGQFQGPSQRYQGSPSFQGQTPGFQGQYTR